MSPLDLLLLGDPNKNSPLKRVFQTERDSLVALYLFHEKRTGSLNGLTLPDLVNGFPGVYTGAITGRQKGMGDGRYSILMGATNTNYINLYSAEFNAAFPRNENTFLFIARTDIENWESAAQQNLCRFDVADGNNLYDFRITAAYEYFWTRKGGGEEDKIQIDIRNFVSTVKLDDWIAYGYTSSDANELAIGYINGEEVGRNAAIGTFAGNLSASRALLGNALVGSTQSWLKNMALVAIWNTPLKPGQMKYVSRLD